MTLGLRFLLSVSFLFVIATYFLLHHKYDIYSMQSHFFDDVKIMQYFDTFELRFKDVILSYVLSKKLQKTCSYYAICYPRVNCMEIMAFTTLKWTFLTIFGRFFNQINLFC